MSFNRSHWMRWTIVLAVVLGTAACGVKSSPAEPEGATYPRKYPAAPGNGAIAKPATKRTAPTTAPGAYQPPPPATQLPN